MTQAIPVSLTLDKDTYGTLTVQGAVKQTQKDEEE